MKICLTTYIYGDNYQDYIPLMIYSIAMSYPEYYLIIFINGTLRSNIKESLMLINKVYDNYEIIEHTFDDCPKMCRIKAQSLRWVMYSEKFKNFDYLYYIDSDILYVKEPTPLHIQHIKHMQYIQSDCISNIVRKHIMGNFEIKQIVRAIKYGGLFNAFRYLSKPYSLRMSGLHFVKVQEYFSYLTPKIIERYKNLIYSGNAWRETVFPNDESLLFNMVKEGGCDTSVFAQQQTSTSMFDLKNPCRKEFCPHHGVHLGIFRLNPLPNWAKEQLDSEDYLYYVNKFKQTYLNEPIFKEIMEVFSTNIQSAFQKMFEYYHINLNE